MSTSLAGPWRYRRPEHSRVVAVLHVAFPIDYCSAPRNSRYDFLYCFVVEAFFSSRFVFPSRFRETFPSHLLSRSLPLLFLLRVKKTPKNSSHTSKGMFISALNSMSKTAALNGETLPSQLNRLIAEASLSRLMASLCMPCWVACSTGNRSGKMMRHCFPRVEAAVVDVLPSNAEDGTKRARTVHP